MGPYEAWGMVKAALGGLGAAVAEFEQSMHWQPQVTAEPTPQRRGPGRPRKSEPDPVMQPGPDDEPRIVTSVQEILVDDEPAPEQVPRRRGRRRVANGLSV